MNYGKLKQIFQELKHHSPMEDLTAHVTFTEDSFDKPYSLLSRTYSFSSDNKAFLSYMGGYSIFGDCLDGTDQGVRLDWYIAEEGRGGSWNIQNCYILEQMRDVKAIPNLERADQDDGTICYYFGNTCIRACETREAGKVRLEPLSGDQAACGEWVDLEIDQVYGYCTLLARHLNGGSGT